MLLWVGQREHALVAQGLQLGFGQLQQLLQLPEAELQALRDQGVLTLPDPQQH